MRPFHILIVDDDESFRPFMVGALKKLGFTNIDRAADGFDALKLLISRQYDLIFLDNQMPLMSGLDFLRRCKHGPLLDRTTVIMLTASADSALVNIIRAEALKVDDFVVKPLDLDTLAAKVDRALRSDRGNPVRRLAEMTDLPDSFRKGCFLSLVTESQGDAATIRLFGFLLNDDRALVKDLPESIAAMTESSIVLDLADVLMIDEFGLGMLLLIGSIATMSGKRFNVLVDNQTIGKRLADMHLSKIIPISEKPPEPKAGRDGS